MKKIVYALSLFLLCMGIYGCGQTSKETGTNDTVIGKGTVSGVLINSFSAPISGATITLTQLDVQGNSLKALSINKVSIASVMAKTSKLFTVVASTTSGPDGSYTFMEVPAGQYRLTAVYDDIAGSKSPITVLSGETTNTGALVLKNTGDIYGAIDIAGTANNSMAIVVLMGTNQVAYTNSSGIYRMYNVPVGTYDLAVTKLGYLDVITQNVIVTINATTTLNEIVLQQDSNYGNNTGAYPDLPVITGVSNNTTYGTTININVVSVSGITFNATIDGDPYVLGTAYSTEGQHKLIVYAINETNGLMSSKIINFKIDTVPPAAPVVSGIVNSQTYHPPVTINVQAVSGVAFNATIDGNSYSFGTGYSTLGQHTLVVTGTKSSNQLTNSTIISFNISTGPDIYIAGYAGVSPNERACYWKNDIRTNLDNQRSIAMGLVYVGSDMYTAGVYLVDGANGPYDIACYWKNGIRYDLTTTRSYVTSIYNNESDVYITGWYQEDHSPSIPCYWKNGVRIDLDPTYWTSNLHGSAYDICVSGADVYVAGEIYGGNPTYKACYWKNGTRTEIGAEESYAMAITESNGDIYVAGDHWYTNSNVACYWKNGNLVNLGVLNMNSEPYSIYVSNSDVYLAGHNLQSGVHTACYWKNGVCTFLSDIQSSARCIRTYGSDIYITGGYSLSGAPIACYWKNGVKTDLESINSYAGSILIKP